jgi:hypothetical protein
VDYHQIEPGRVVERHWGSFDGLLARRDECQFSNRLSCCVQCIVQDDHPEFDKYFESNHLKYLEHAEQRLKEVEALPGPVVTIG